MREIAAVILASIAAAAFLAFAIMWDSTWRPALIGIGVGVLIAAGYATAEAVLLFRQRHPRQKNRPLEGEEEP